MDIINKTKTVIKDNPFIRGCWSLYKEYFGIKRRSFGYIGDDVKLIPPLNLSNPKNVYLYGLNKIEHATISTNNAKFIMKYGAAAAEGLSVHTGNHMQLVGKYYRTITEENKRESDEKYDKDVVVEEDVWIGCNVTLLSGITLGRSSVIAAGAVVTKDIPPYCIAGGVPAKFIKFKWTKEQILQHEEQLYAEEGRLSEETLDALFEKYQ